MSIAAPSSRLAFYVYPIEVKPPATKVNNVTSKLDSSP